MGPSGPASRRQPIHDVHALTGTPLEVFYSDRTLETFGRSGAGWFLLVSSARAPTRWPADWAIRYELQAFKHAMMR